MRLAAWTAVLLGVAASSGCFSGTLIPLTIADGRLEAVSPGAIVAAALNASGRSAAESQISDGLFTFDAEGRPVSFILWLAQGGESTRYVMFQYDSTYDEASHEFRVGGRVREIREMPEGLRLSDAAIERASRWSFGEILAAYYASSSTPPKRESAFFLEPACDPGPGTPPDTAAKTLVRANGTALEVAPEKHALKCASFGSAFSFLVNLSGGSGDFIAEL